MLARPRQVDTLKFISVDIDALNKGGEEIYPIVHDLAWYMIKRSFDDFLEYQSLDKGEEPEDKGEEFLKAYMDHLGLNHLSVYAWAISSAITYMKSLGFNRKDNGNGYTDASHGSKSKLFTQEEKYTWLAVHYIQGYLSDYLPLKDSEEFVLDYMQIINVDNPAEQLAITVHEEMLDIEDNWIVKELLAPEMEESRVAKDERSKYERGKAVLEELTGVSENEPKTGYAAFAPQIEIFLKEHLFVNIFERDILTYKERELATISVLAATRISSGREPRTRAAIKSHKSCLN
ncbi:hypothetical protein SAMN06265348_11910 [Pedobacter westerhofensis]|uniref:Uncharacterized protein n=2 Tax=Pedobacter westerhofensis TaxID=425512 RepID=A0A521FS86_9SPHI|nr:hypothetical protein SAMN06265348_11910 [Pedobacter westerhofensis]